jgi:Spy/CpxP family protein refolding chaperone
MKRFAWILAFAVTVAPAIAAQQPQPVDTVEAGRLRRQIEERFSQRVQQQLGLTADQTTKLRATQEQFGTRRRAVMRQQLERRLALQGQMRPGEAANADSVRKLMDGMQAGRAEMLKIEQDEDREMAGYLTPVQRARYQMMRQQLLERVNQMREQRRGRMGPGARGPGRAGMRPEGGRRPGRRPIN